MAQEVEYQVDLASTLRADATREKLERFWAVNGLLACHLVGPEHKRRTRDEAVAEFVRKVGGEVASVQFAGVVPIPHANDEFGVYRANLGYHTPDAWLIAAARYGTCWYVAFSPRVGGALVGVLP